MTESMVAVAAIWVNAPASTHGQNIGGVSGSPDPVIVSTPARKSRAKGNPNRNRT
jgi:hypothetical protein